MSNRAWRLFTTIGVIAIMSFLTGCMVVPIPNVRVEGAGVRSQIVDADSGLPVASATVSVPLEGGSVRTNAKGEFKIAPHYQLHLAYLWGVISYPIVPFTGDIIEPERRIHIVAQGYEPVDYSLTCADMRSGAPHAIENIPLKADYLLPPKLTLRKMPKDIP